MSNDQTILLGAVAYDPKVVTIWEGIREHFSEQGVPLDFALFSNYERQVESLLQGHIDIAWILLWRMCAFDNEPAESRTR